MMLLFSPARPGSEFGYFAELFGCEIRGTSLTAL